jgi:hypothetical protein
MEVIENKGIIPKVMGGLGNQIFIIIAGFIGQKVHNCPLYIFNNHINNNKHNINNFNYNQTIFKYFGTHIDTFFDDYVLLSLLSYGYKIHNMLDSDGFKKWDPETLIPGTITSSYYQYYPTIKLYESEIRELLIKGLENHNNKMNIDNPDSTAFLHIRHGDYLNFPDIHFIQPLEYYINALNDLIQKKQINKIYIFSDDINWVKSVPFFQKILFEIIDSQDELYCIHLMSQCKGGAICANSTFSWWGAFLGAHSLKNPVYIPKKWISLNVESLFPDDWIEI